MATFLSSINPTTFTIRYITVHSIAMFRLEGNWHALGYDPGLTSNRYGGVDEWAQL
jgi:hypothetical protein